MKAKRTHFGLNVAAFTLIELLVVVAIIALLVSILLPSLAGAREQAKAVKCLANLKQVGNAMAAYFQDTEEWFPHGNSNGHAPTGIYYGGHPGRPSPDNPDRNWIYENKDYRTTPAGRPFNPYLYPNLPNYDVPTTDAQFDAVRNVPIFWCPSDAGGVFMNEKNEDPHSVRPMYYEWGTSYDAMYHWPSKWAMEVRDGTGGGRGNPKDGKRYLHLSNAFSKIQLRFNSATSVIIYEDSFDNSQYSRFPRRGWHKKMNTHNMLFMDSHAATVTADTTKYPYHRGKGWKTNSGGEGNWPAGVWWTDRLDPDYKYRMIPPLSGD